MSLSSSITRASEYYKRHGIAETVRRAVVAVKRAVFANRMVVFYCDLAKVPATPTNLPELVRIARVWNEEDLTAQDREAILGFWNPQLAWRNMRERFEKGATLWIIQSGTQLAGFSWTLRGATIAPYYFPMGPDDIQIFDFFVFPKFRGRAILWVLIMHILRSLAAEGGARAFGDVAEWNQASLSFYKMTPFRRLGLVRTYTLLGHRFTRWVEEQPGGQPQEVKQTRRCVPAVARQHER